MNAHELKGLQVQISKAKVTEENALVASRMANQEYSKAKLYREGLEKTLEQEKQKSAEPIVTEHALLRYIERVYNVNLDSIRQAILSPATLNAIRIAGNGTFPIEAGGRIVVKNNTVVSITD